MTEEKKVTTDLNEYYNKKISSLLEEIDQIKMGLDNNPKSILLLNQRLHTLFLRLYKKCDIKKKDFITMQKKYNYTFEKYKTKMWKIVNKENGYGEMDGILKLSKYFYRLKKLLEDREIHLNEMLEWVGFTADEKIKRRRVI